MKKEILLYIAVSAIAWLVDVAVLYFAAILMGMPAYLAAALGYAVGLLVHYALSVRYVFTYRRMAGRRHAEMLLYALTGVLGIALSAGIVHIGTLLGLTLIVSKLIATGVTFIAVFIIRKRVLFSTVQADSGKLP